jgi:hypothetical protein
MTNIDKIFVMGIFAWYCCLVYLFLQLGGANIYQQAIQHQSCDKVLAFGFCFLSASNFF